jgi:undecaprenyl-diphosphatase
VTELHLILVALVQGITEFLPISSQAHLILVPRLTGWCDQGLVIDIAVHVGTLGAVVAYFWRDCLRMAGGGFALLRGRLTADGKILLYLIVATLPVVAAGAFVKLRLGLDMRSVAVIGWTTAGYGVLLWIADRWGIRVRRMEHLGWRTAILIGCAQALALVPGTSRSGVTMTAARMLGFERSDAARFSLLLAIPAILAAGTLAGLELAATGDARLTGDAVTAAALAFLTALVAIAALMRWLRSATFTPFVIYRLILGGVLLTAVYGFGVDETVLHATCTR